MAKTPPPTPPRPISPLAGVLSYLVPGLGQIYQRRYAKGLLFFFCIYVLFFYGNAIGSGSVTYEEETYVLRGNVYLPSDPERSVPSDLFNRWQFVGQFPVGIAAWPAVAQYLFLTTGPAAEARNEASELKKANKDSSEAERRAREQEQIRRAQKHPVFGTLQREPSMASINAVHNAGDKRLELAWVFTVIAGVLNVLVIYDAVVGAPSGHQKKAS